MSLPSKVLWSEGLTLGPQQFQQQDRYHEARLQRIAAAINPHAWGVHSVQWNHDGLANNLLIPDLMSLIFQDGEIFDAPATDTLPSTIDLSKLPMTEQCFTFYAALPTLKAHGSNLSDSPTSHNGARYVQVESDTADLFTEAFSIDVAFLRKTVHLLSHLESRNAFVSFPVVRVRRVANGGFEIDPAFVPPSLSVAAAPWLQVMLNKLLSKLSIKIESLYLRHRQSSTDVFEVHSGDISSYWMLNTVSTAAASLTHCATYKQHHPEILFDKLMSLAGGLMTFSKKYAVSDLPSYNHIEPAHGFARLDTIVRELIETVISSRYFTIPLVMVERKSTHYCGQLDTSQVNSRTALFLAVNADMPALELVAAVPLRFKVGSPEEIERFIGLALSGVELIHMAQVPPEVPVRPNTYYFSIQNKGPLYEAMLKRQSIAIYVPAGMNGLKLELFAIAA